MNIKELNQRFEGSIVLGPGTHSPVLNLINGIPHAQAFTPVFEKNGTAAVELALVLPVFLRFIFSTLELDMALYNKNVPTNHDH